MRAVRILVEDFQAIERAEVEATGITCVVGPSNSGKTALLRALEACFYNRSGDDFVRNPGGKSSRVSVEFVGCESGDDMKVEWTKPRGAGASYRVDGVLLEKVGRGPVSEVVDRGLAPLVTKSDSHRLNFWRQKTYFLVDSTESKFFDVVNELMSEKAVAPVLAAMKADCQEWKRKADIAEKAMEGERAEVERLTAVLASMDAVDASDPGCRSLVALVSLASDYDDSVRRLELLTSDAARAAAELAAVSGELGALDGLDSPLEWLAKADAAMDLVARARASAAAASAAESELAGVEAELAALDGLDELSALDARASGAGSALSASKSARASAEAAESEMALASSEISKMDDEIERAVEALSEGVGECPTCGAPTLDGKYYGGKQ